MINIDQNFVSGSLCITGLVLFAIQVKLSKSEMPDSSDINIYSFDLYSISNLIISGIIMLLGIILRYY